MPARRDRDPDRSTEPCAAKGLQPNIALQASAPDAVADLASRGLGVAILSESMAANYAGRLVAVAVDDIETPVVFALIWTTTPSPALRELLRHSHEAFANPQIRQALPAGDRTAR